MKAIRIHEYGGAGTLKLEEVPRISITDDHVLVRVHDAGEPGPSVSSIAAMPASQRMSW